jgi:hypothetical protein
MNETQLVDGRSRLYRACVRRAAIARRLRHHLRLQRIAALVERRRGSIQ